LRRGAIGVNTLVSLAVLLIVVFVMLGLIPGFTQKLQAAESASTCSWSILLASVQKLGSAGIAQGIPEGCKAIMVNVSMKDLEKNQRLASNRISEFMNKPDIYKSQYFTNTNKETLNEFALDKILADELVDCWEKVFKGKMPLFDEWWRLYSWKEGNPGSGPVALQVWNVQVHGPPVNCVICSRITFSDEVISQFKQKQIISLEEWMSLNPVPRTNTPYLQYIYEGQTGTDLFKPKYRPKYSFVADERGLAVLYQRVNVHGLESAVTTPLKWIGAIPEKTPDLNYLKLVPYSQEAIISQDGEGCTLIID
jgi:hypothetical protein